MGDTYEGWTNYETWNVVLWIDNDYGLYTARLAADTTTPESCEAFVRECSLPRTRLTPDGAELSKVDWAEVSEHWSAES